MLHSAPRPEGTGARELAGGPAAGVGPGSGSRPRSLREVFVTFTLLALQGFGLVQAARFMAIPHIEKGELVEILPQWKPAPLPISVLYPQNRHLSPKVRAFADWAADLFAQCPLLSGKDEDYDPSLCTFGGKPPESTTQRDIIEQRNVAESVL